MPSGRQGKLGKQPLVFLYPAEIVSPVTLPEDFPKVELRIFLFKDFLKRPFQFEVFFPVFVYSLFSFPVVLRTEQRDHAVLFRTFSVAHAKEYMVPLQRRHRPVAEPAPPGSSFVAFYCLTFSRKNSAALHAALAALH